MLRVALRQNHVDAPAVHVDDLETPASPQQMITRLRQFMQLREDETSKCHVVARRRFLYANELHHVRKRNGGVDEVRTVLALRDFGPYRGVDFG